MTAPSAPTPPPGSLLYVPSSYVDALPLAEMFPKAQPVELELGAGDGSFLALWASAHPERNFIGVERLLGRIRKLDRKGRRAALTNLRLIRLEAAYTLEYLIPHVSISALHIYFPDPWPKKKHRRHRLINQRFPDVAKQALVPGGVVHLRTDDADYFAQMQEVFAARNDFKLVAPPAELNAVLTDFEREFNTKGIPTQRASYRMA
ncbi:MAG TPA: tRNA (guanosine(46)-N7)-methyltransferase TrmB [Verrucomicrobiae bacterium]|jgi:tRNA (guanine-N7-)-methyltransferase